MDIVLLRPLDISPVASSVTASSSTKERLPRLSCLAGDCRRLLEAEIWSKNEDKCSCDDRHEYNKDDIDRIVYEAECWRCWPLNLLWGH